MGTEPHVIYLSPVSAFTTQLSELSNCEEDPTVHGAHTTSSLYGRPYRTAHGAHTTSSLNGRPYRKVAVSWSRAVLSRRTDVWVGMFLMQLRCKTAASVCMSSVHLNCGC